MSSLSPPGASSGSTYKVATVEDCLSDEDDLARDVGREANTKTRRTAAANVSSTAPVRGGDAASDSGYSSHAAGTASSSIAEGPSPAATMVHPSYPPDAPPTSRGRPKLLATKTVPLHHQHHHYQHHHHHQPPPPPPPPPPSTRSRRYSVAPAEPTRPVMPPAQDRCYRPIRRPRRGNVVVSEEEVGPPGTGATAAYPPVHHHRSSSRDVPIAAPVRMRPEVEGPPPPPRSIPVAVPRPRLPRSQSSRPVSYHEGTAYPVRYFAPAPELMFESNIPPLGGRLPSVETPPTSSSSSSSSSSAYPPSRYIPAQPLGPPPIVPHPSGSYTDSSPYVPPLAPSQRWPERYPSGLISAYGPPLTGYEMVPPPVMPSAVSRRPSDREYDLSYMRSPEEDGYFRMPPPAPPPPPPPPPPTVGPRISTRSSTAREWSRLRSMPQPDGPDLVPYAYSWDGVVPRLRRLPSCSNDGGPRPDSTSDEVIRARQVAEKRRRRATTYYSQEAGGSVERGARTYPDGGVDAAAAALQGLHLRRPAGSRAGSDSGSSGRPGPDGKVRPPSGVTTGALDSDDSFNMRLTASRAVTVDFIGHGGFDRQTVSFRPGQDGEQPELSIGSRKNYFDHTTGAYVECGRSGRRREIETGPSGGPSRSSTHSRRSSRAAVSRRQMPQI